MKDSSHKYDDLKDTDPLTEKQIGAIPFFVDILLPSEEKCATHMSSDKHRISKGI